METWGQVGYLTSEEEGIMQDFIKRAPAEQLEASRYTVETKEQVACRFLRAREFRIEDSLILLKKAYDLLQEHEADTWAASGADDCLGADEKLVKTFYPHQAQGYDRYGRLLCFEHNGNTNFAAIKSVTNRTNMLRYHLYSMERCYDEYFTKSPKNPAGLSTVGMCCICDLEHLSLSQVSAGIDHLKTLIALDNICYPEQLGKLVVVNVPGFIAGVYNMIKGLLAPRTQRKIEMIASGPEVSRRLKELISLENLPNIYGGLAPNPYKKKPYTEYVAVPRDGVLQKTHTVQNGMIFNIDVYVCEGPIEITISYKSVNSEPVFVEKNKMMEVAVADTPSRHQFSVPASNEERVFTVIWKNSHWMSSRHICYSFTTLPSTSSVTPNSSSLFGIGTGSKKLDTPHKMAEPPVYKVHTVRGTIIDGGGNAQQDNVFVGFLKSLTTPPRNSDI